MKWKSDLVPRSIFFLTSFSPFISVEILSACQKLAPGSRFITVGTTCSGLRQESNVQCWKRWNGIEQYLRLQESPELANICVHAVPRRKTLNNGWMRQNFVNSLAETSYAMLGWRNVLHINIKSSSQLWSTVEGVSWFGAALLAKGLEILLPLKEQQIQNCINKQNWMIRKQLVQSDRHLCFRTAICRPN